MDKKKKVSIRLLNQNANQKDTDNDVALYVPDEIGGGGLSKILNEYFRKKREPEIWLSVQFRFFIEGVLLQGTLKGYLEEKGLTHESVLAIEYSEENKAPSYSGVIENDDWISSIDTLTLIMECGNGGGDCTLLLSGSYNGETKVHNLSGEVIGSVLFSQTPVKCVRWASENTFIVSSNDSFIKMFKIKKNRKETEFSEKKHCQIKHDTIFKGHEGPVVSLDVLSKKKKFVSSGYDNKICLWSMINENNLSSATEALSQDRKRKMSDTNQDSISPLTVFLEHTQPVEDTIFDKNDSSFLYSVSQDHSLKLWDLVTSCCLNSRLTDSPLLSVLHLPALNLLAASSSRSIHLFDPRSDDNLSKIPVSKLTGHKNFVVSTSISPFSNYSFCSGSYDSTVMIWDVRSSSPLHIIRRESDLDEYNNKVFDVVWDAHFGIVSCGQDKKIQFNKFE